MGIISLLLSCVSRHIETVVGWRLNPGAKLNRQSMSLMHDHTKLHQEPSCQCWKVFFLSCWTSTMPAQVKQLLSPASWNCSKVFLHDSCLRFQWQTLPSYYCAVGFETQAVGLKCFVSLSEYLLRADKNARSVYWKRFRTLQPLEGCCQCRNFAVNVRLHFYLFHFSYCSFLFCFCFQCCKSRVPSVLASLGVSRGLVRSPLFCVVSFLCAFLAYALCLPSFHRSPHLDL